jgi:hypothetical protein
VSTRLLLEGSDLAELMGHVRAEFGPNARIIHAERVRSGGVVGFFARERYELTVDVPEAPLARPRGLRAPMPVMSGAVGLDALLAAADAAEAFPQLGGAGRQLGSVPAAPGRAEVSTGADAFASVLEQVRAMTGGPTFAADVEVLPPAVSTLTTAAPARDATPSGTTRAALIELGVPERVLAPAGIDEPAPLSVLLANVPAAPELPRAHGSVIVVVGPTRDAEAVGLQVAERLGQAPSTVVLAGQGEPGAGNVRRITDARAAARWRAGTDSGRVRVVALAVGPEARDRAEASVLLAALDPDRAWGVVDARMKPRDTARWLAEVGSARQVDALAVRGLFSTTQPGTVLSLGLPVAWFDGIPATRVAWAAALSQHLELGLRWD